VTANMTETERRARIDQALAALPELGDQAERVQLQWNGQRLVFPVVNVPLEAVVLNPVSHRIKAELESHPNQPVVEADPFSDEAQVLIAELLRLTPDFVNLKGDLAANGQTDYGVVTHAGLLVNANTRAVALRDLHKNYIKVAVLPEDADQASIEELEAQLQLAIERKQPYSFPNELLFIEDMKRRNMSDRDIALMLGYAVNTEAREVAKGEKEVQQRIRMLSLAREVGRLSGGRLPLTYFEGRRQILIEIDEEYEKTKGRDGVGAERVKNARLLGLLTNVYYRELRDVDATFLSDYLPVGLAENDLIRESAAALEDHTAAVADEEAFALFSPDDEQSPIPDVSVFLNALAASHGEDTLTLPGGTGPVSRDATISAFTSVYNAAVDDYRNDKKAADSISAPLTQLTGVVKTIKKATDTTKSVKHKAGFDAEALRGKIASAHRHLDALEAELAAAAPTADA
jgi:hypothetical protein